ncbi:DUF885 domain-containing protein [Actinosynnema sp. NPDC047251]|uniref:Secreted protein n=1 Tax=Saccharothrix espanaensis (strain ATCC 51144 / DSM 44229 / JCM 9112 / NBRC 15066 / NRRL 15764) TaxID=1179773 RepID=K0JVA7_SACES|nr:DUF885 domain-containing protein [Saccharothrix espanaensis]CCH28088.1 hypothetical protein BN6_07590 [Saccharothrix espanaensis DSM 44229]
MDTTAALADELLDLMSRLSPLGATIYGLPGYDHLLADHRPETEETTRAAAVRIAERARALPDDDDPVTRAVVVQQAESTVDLIDARSVEYTITDSFFAPAGELLSVLPIVAPADEEQERAYLSRLATVPAFLRTVAERQVAGSAAGRTPVQHLVAAALAHLDRYLAAEEDPFARPQGGAGFTAERDRLIAGQVRPAFAAYRDVVAGLSGRPTDQVGLCWLPEGEAVYAALARAQTTTTRSPKELHETGLAIMAELAEEYAELGERVFGTRDTAAVFERMREDPALRWRSEDELISAAREAVTRAEEAAPRWFGRVPERRCEVEPVPAVDAPGAPTAFYAPPSMDGTRLGTYYANTHRVEERFRYQAEAIAFHEAVPGHHFQIVLAQELADLPMLRRVATVTGYLEGWGLYCERLADEMGLYSDDVARLGMLAMDSMRAGRLVVDTGLHAHGWSRERAIAYLRENTPLAQVEIESEVDRYIAAPGQALAYMVGRLEIQRVRAEAERALGDRFDIRAFHDVVLGGGPLPLAVLDEVVRTWVAAQA